MVGDNSGKSEVRGAGLRRSILPNPRGMFLTTDSLTPHTVIVFVDEFVGATVPGKSSGKER